MKTRTARLRKLGRVVVATACALCALEAAAAVEEAVARAVAATAKLPDSAQIEKDLQRLPWPRFRSVVESIPRMKADVDAYGPLGWEYVRTHYRTHRWKKNIDRLDAAQRQRLAELIRTARDAR